MNGKNFQFGPIKGSRLFLLSVLAMMRGESVLYESSLDAKNRMRFVSLENERPDRLTVRKAAKK